MNTWNLKNSKITEVKIYYRNWIRGLWFCFSDQVETEIQLEEKSGTFVYLVNGRWTLLKFETT